MHKFLFVLGFFLRMNPNQWLLLLPLISNGLEFLKIQFNNLSLVILSQEIVLIYSCGEQVDKLKS